MEKIFFINSFVFYLQEIYNEIIAQSRSVGTCIRALEAAALTKTKSIDSGASSDKESSSLEIGTEVSPESKSDGISPSSGRRSGGSSDGALTKGLERRYHLLYLKAIEIQCLLEGLLSRKNSPVSVFVFINFDLILIHRYMKNCY